MVARGVVGRLRDVFPALWVERFRGDSAFREDMRGTRDQIVKAPEVASRPVIDTVQTDLMALLPTAIKRVAGRSTCFARSSVTRRSSRAALVLSGYNRHSTALTDDLRRAVEASSGRPLGWFFDQWLRRPGFAEVTTSWRYDASQRRVVATIAQGSRFGAYRFRSRWPSSTHRQGTPRNDRRPGFRQHHTRRARRDRRGTAW
jgi:hypothetical protein